MKRTPYRTVTISGTSTSGSTGSGNKINRPVNISRWMYSRVARRAGPYTCIYVCVYIIYEIIWVYSFCVLYRLRFGSITMINSGISPELTQCWPPRVWSVALFLCLHEEAKRGETPDCMACHASDQYAASGASLSHFHRHHVPSLLYYSCSCSWCC